jgi:hypothetical protein
MRAQDDFQQPSQNWDKLRRIKACVCSVLKSASSAGNSDLALEYAVLDDIVSASKNVSSISET